jgi:hypothetical protein
MTNGVTTTAHRLESGLVRLAQPGAQVPYLNGVLRKTAREIFLDQWQMSNEKWQVF